MRLSYERFTLTFLRALPAVRQEFAGGMAGPVATRDWTSVVQNANTTNVTNTT